MSHDPGVPWGCQQILNRACDMLAVIECDAVAVTVSELDHVIIHADDWDACHTFYVDALGLESVEIPKARRTPWALGSTDSADSRSSCTVNWPGRESACCPPPLNEVGRADLALRTAPTPSQYLDLLQPHGIDIAAGPVRRFGAREWGTSVYCQDPSGNGIELISYRDE